LSGRASSHRSQRLCFKGEQLSQNLLKVESELDSDVYSENSLYSKRLRVQHRNVQAIWQLQGPLDSYGCLEVSESLPFVGSKKTFILACSLILNKKSLKPTYFGIHSTLCLRGLSTLGVPMSRTHQKAGYRSPSPVMNHSCTQCLLSF
jgi:hypothetical protein